MKFLASFGWKTRRERELDEELSAHLAMAVSERIEQGEAPAEAEANARREFGNVPLVKDVTRDMWGWRWLETLLQDVRYGLRQIRRNPGFTITAVLTLALGIGATTAVFSILDNVLIRPWPYRNADRLTRFMIHDLSQAAEKIARRLSVSEFLEFRKQNHVFSEMIGIREHDVFLTIGKQILDVLGADVTANTFRFLGVKPLLGRTIMPGDGNPWAPPVFMMSYRLWRQQFNGEQKIVGTVFTLNGERRTLVGIMPPRFQYGEGRLSPSVWMSIAMVENSTAMTDIGPFDPDFQPMGRLKSGVSLQAAASDLGVIAGRLAKADPKAYPKRFKVLTMTLTDATVPPPFKAALYTLLAASGLLLLIACSNVGNILLARAMVREREFAVRAALGASRGRLLTQLIVESLMLAAIGGILGVASAYGGLHVLLAVLAPFANFFMQQIPAEAVIALNRTALVFAVCVTVLTTLLCGLAPALYTLRGHLGSHLKAGRKGAGCAFRRGMFRSVLVTAEMALAIIMLAGAGLMMRTFVALQSANLGFDPAKVLEAGLATPPGRHLSFEQERVVLRQVLHRVAALPNVIAATPSSCDLVPFVGAVSKLQVIVPGTTDSEDRYAMYQMGGAGWFETLGRHLIRGRLFSDAEVDLGRRVAVINQRFARLFFGQENPIGKMVEFSALNDLPETPHGGSFEIIGIVGNAPNQGIKQPPMPEAILPYRVSGFGLPALLVRTRGDALASLKSIRREVRAVDPDMTLREAVSIATMLEEQSYAQPRFVLYTLGIFAGIGLVLAAIGVFGVMTFSVARRTHEIGIRMALGAEKSDVLRMIIRQGIKLSLVGVVIGIAGALALTRFLSSLLYGVTPTDPLTFIMVSLILIAVALLACYIPARRAAKVDPMVVAQIGARPSDRDRRAIETAYVQLDSGRTGISYLRYLYSEPLRILMGIVALVLLVACANVANLLLSRSTARQREIAMRLTVGASRTRLVRQMLTESALLGISGGAAGLLLAYWGVHLLSMLVSRDLVMRVTTNPAVLVFTLAVSMVTGLVFGLIPAMRVSRTELSEAMRGASQSGGRLQSSLTRALVIVQVAFSLVLLAGAGLLVRTLINLESQRLGFNGDNVLLVQTDPSLAGHKVGELEDLYRRLLDRLNALPGVRSASIAYYSPMSGHRSSTDLKVEGYTPHSGEVMLVNENQVSPNFFATLGIPVRLGREIGTQDTATSRRVVVVNQAFADRYFHGQNPVGRHIWVGSRTPTTPPQEVIGVVADSRNHEPGESPEPFAYLPLSQDPEFFAGNIQIRTARDPSGAAAEVRQATQSVDSALPVISVETLRGQVRGRLNQQRLVARLSVLFSLLGLVLSAVGIYGVISYWVTQRTREIGVRMALGAHKHDVLRLVVRHGLTMTLAGIGLGLAAAFALTRLIRGSLYDITPTDPLTFIVVSLILIVVALLACYIPARRAAKVDPMVALRYE
ncbi:MAG TPA: ABC transporter permease [Terriglobia bacterium]|nr:ABC transporter permease [Terriglobia bacterium]